MADQLIQGKDFAAEIRPNSVANGTGQLIQLYSPSQLNGIFYSADIVNFAIRVDVPSFDPVEIDVAAYSSADELGQRQIILDAIYNAGAKWMDLTVILRVGVIDIELIQVPVYNSGLPSQVINLNRFFSSGVARVAPLSALFVRLDTAGHGVLAGQDKLQIWGHAIEEVWVPNQEMIALAQAINTLATATSNQAQTVTQLLGTVEAVLALQSSLIANQNDLIQLLASTGINPGGGGGNNTNSEEVTRMRAYFDPSGSVDIGAGTTTVPTEPPAAGAVAPATLGGITLRANMDVIWERPYDGNAFDARHDEYTYTLYSASGALRWRPISRRFLGNNDGTWMAYLHHWDGTQWVQHPHY